MINALPNMKQLLTKKKVVRREFTGLYKIYLMWQVRIKVKIILSGHVDNIMTVIFD